MRVHTVSDVHIDYKQNFDWLMGLSDQDFQQDILILAGDLTDELNLLETSFRVLKDKFSQVLYVPGNHELWVKRCKSQDSLVKFKRIIQLAEQIGITTKPYIDDKLTIIPLLSWYDFSFGAPDEQLKMIWKDFYACKWPHDHGSFDKINNYFLEQNWAYLNLSNQKVISFSHFLPRIDLMPSYIPLKYRNVYPVLGTMKLEKQVRQIRPNIHIYGHSHVNRNVVIDEVRYINNAFAYPNEHRISAKQLLCVYQD